MGLMALKDYDDGSSSNKAEENSLHDCMCMSLQHKM